MIHLDGLYSQAEFAKEYIMKKIYLLVLSCSFIHGSDVPENEIQKVPGDETQKVAHQLCELVKVFRGGFSDVA